MHRASDRRVFVPAVYGDARSTAWPSRREPDLRLEHGLRRTGEAELFSPDSHELIPSRPRGLSPQGSVPAEPDGRPIAAAATDEEPARKSDCGRLPGRVLCLPLRDEPVPGR